MQLTPTGQAPKSVPGASGVSRQTPISRADAITDLDLPPHGEDFEIIWRKGLFGVPYPSLVWTED